MAAPSTRKHFTDTPAVQFSRVRIANTNQQQWHYLAETARPQPWLESAGGTNRNTRSSQLCLSQRRCKTNKHCTASSISKPSSASITVHRFLFILSLNIKHCYIHSSSDRHDRPENLEAVLRQRVSWKLTSWNFGFLINPYTHTLSPS